MKKALGLRPASIALLVSSFALYAFYLSYTGPGIRNPDAASHMAYVRHVAATWTLPAARDCSVCHHPPLYYGAAALLFRATAALGWSGMRGVQLLSLLSMVVFGVTSALSIARLLPRPYQQRIATALVLFWPSTVTSAARVNNDVAFYAVAALCFHFLVLWWSAGGRKWLIAASLAALVGLFVKANAVILVGLVVAVVPLRLLRLPERKARARAAIPVVAALVALTSVHGFVRGEHESLAKNVLGTAYKTAPKDLDPRPLRYYTGLEPGPFVRTPYAEVQRFHDREPRFWNHWLKSSLFGSRNRIFAFLAPHEPAALGDIAQALNAFLLALLALSLAGLVITWREASETRWLAGLAMAVYGAAAVGFHLLIPAAHHADFRFAFPVLVPASVLFSDIIGRLRRERVILWHAGYLLTELVVVFSAAYFVVAS